MHQPPPAGTAPSSNNTLKVVLIVLGALFVLGAGTCVGTCMYAKSKVTELAASIGEAGVTLASPPEVRAALAGPKSDYLGTWSNGKGGVFEIAADGAFKFEKEGGKTVAPIAAFDGNNIVIKVLVTITFKIAVAPHRVGDHFELVMDGATFTRKP
jgi:hypothetical protein